MGRDAIQETLRTIVGYVYPRREDVGGRRFLQRWVVRSERALPTQDELDSLADRLLGDAGQLIREAYVRHVSVKRLEDGLPGASMVRLDDRHCVVVIELPSRQDGIGDEDMIGMWAILRGVDAALGIEDLQGLPKARWFQLR